MSSERITTTHPIVMPGLDPGIHLSEYRRRQVSDTGVDCRVKPGNDDFGNAGSAPSMHRATAVYWMMREVPKC